MSPMYFRRQVMGESGMSVKKYRKHLRPVKIYDSFDIATKELKNRASGFAPKMPEDPSKPKKPRAKKKKKDDEDEEEEEEPPKKKPTKSSWVYLFLVMKVFVPFNKPISWLPRRCSFPYRPHRWIRRFKPRLCFGAHFVSRFELLDESVLLLCPPLPCNWIDSVFSVSYWITVMFRSLSSSNHRNVIQDVLLHYLPFLLLCWSQQFILCAFCLDPHSRISNFSMTILSVQFTIILIVSFFIERWK